MTKVYENNNTIEQRTSCIFYSSWQRALKEIPNMKTRLSIYEALLDYSLNGVIPTRESLYNNYVAIMFMELAIPNIDANIEKRQQSIIENEAKVALANNNKQKAIELYKSGKTIEAIADELQVAQSTIYRYLANVNAKINSQSEKINSQGAKNILASDKNNAKNVCVHEKPKQLSPGGNLLESMSKCVDVKDTKDYDKTQVLCKKIWDVICENKFPTLAKSEVNFYHGEFYNGLQALDSSNIYLDLSELIQAIKNYCQVIHIPNSWYKAKNLTFNKFCRANSLSMFVPKTFDIKQFTPAVEKHMRTKPAVDMQTDNSDAMYECSLVC